MKTGHAQPEILSKGRIEAFSDGVIAVAITLLVLDLRVPEPDGAGNLAYRLFELWPNYAAYVISFAAIGIMWINHHTMLRRLNGVDHTVLLLNLLLLLCIVVLPFTTSLLATYLDVPGDGSVAAVVYAGSFFVTSTVFFSLQALLMLRRPQLLREHRDGSESRTILLRAAIAPPTYLIAAAAGLLSPYLTLGICVILGVFYLVAPGTAPSPSSPSSQSLLSKP